MKADLHIHSTFSDGSASIEQIIEAGLGMGLDAIAITDHDTLSHVAQIPDDTGGMQVIPGVEISAVCHKTKTRAHVLGYNIRKPEIITELTQPLLNRRNMNSEKQVDILIKHGYKIDINKLARADEKYLYKQHIMDWLVTTGQAPDMFGEFYKKTFKRGGICFLDTGYIDVFEAVLAIKESGGLAVLAHPGQQQNFRLIPGLVEIGLAGLEFNHHSHSDKDAEVIREYADKYSLFLTGGSDYHGRYESRGSHIGEILSDESGALAITVDIQCR